MASAAVMNPMTAMPAIDSVLVLIHGSPDALHANDVPLRATRRTARTLPHPSRYGARRCARADRPAPGADIASGGLPAARGSPRPHRVTFPWDASSPRFAPRTRVARGGALASVHARPQRSRGGRRLQRNGRARQRPASPGRVAGTNVAPGRRACAARADGHQRSRSARSCASRWEAVSLGPGEEAVGELAVAIAVVSGLAATSGARAAPVLGA